MKPVSSCPDFRNLGILLRVLLAACLLLFVNALAAGGGESMLWRLLRLSRLVVPGLLASLSLLALLTPALQRLRWPQPWVAGLAAGCFTLFEMLLTPEQAVPWQHPLLVALFSLLLLYYFSLRERALSPALAEARLAALQARIRPHFLFNALNTAIALIRLQPAQAETVLENLSDLFRAQLADPGRQSTLEREIELAAMYLAIEKERLGSRLRVNWDIQAPLDAALPPLILQPLVENAVHHGVEPWEFGAGVDICARRDGPELELTVRNPLPPEIPEQAQPRGQGNHIALNNLRERLELFYDAEALLEVRKEEGHYQVRLRLPYRQAAPASMPYLR